MNYLNHRLKKLERSVAGEPWFLLVIDDFTLEYIHPMLDVSGKSRKQKGTLALVSSSNDSYGSIQYEPDDIEKLKLELEHKTLELEEAKKQADVNYLKYGFSTKKYGGNQVVFTARNEKCESRV